MPRENIELLRRLYEAFARADREAVRDLLALEMEVRDRESQPDRAVYTGPEGFEKLIETALGRCQQTHSLREEPAAVLRTTTLHQPV
jgi:ketosteroid isomerase-like protein